ncbi:MAG: dipeptide epimerase [Candidatus Marinimicrobia bacterium]|nr:dipeptide epimerase [Candidatus Neomarinimicrobiota bacterium]
MNLDYTTYRIICSHPFGISRSIHNYYDIVYVYMSDEGYIGRGEAAPSARYDESTNKVTSQLESIDSMDGNLSLEEGMQWCRINANGISSLEAALTTAWLDLWTQKNKKSISDLFQSGNNMLYTSFTIAIGDLDLIPMKIEEAQSYQILKIKLGVSIEHDKQIIKLIRNETDKLIRIDANEGWNLDTGKEMCNWLADYNVEFIEQPFKADNLIDTAKLRDVSPLPLVADENSIKSSNIPDIAHAFDGINIKLMKCGSLLEAKKMIDLAHNYDMKIMLGCMVESSVGITAMSNLSSQVDFADLDGNLLINNDPYDGVNIIDGKIKLPSGNGLGITLNAGYKNEYKNLK